MAFGAPICAATFKQEPADFIVEERLSFDADDEGPHWLVQIEKNDINTLNMLDELATTLRVPRRAMGYSGLKDRFAISRQWLTLPVQSVAYEQLLAASGARWHVIAASLHRRKLRVGSHRSNFFKILLRDMPNDRSIREALEQRLATIAERGVPNYFGPQRFGRGASNLRKAEQLLLGGRRLPRQQHRFAVSAARSAVFNAVVSRRVANGNWNTFVEGDVVILDGSNSWFTLSRLGEDRGSRLDEHDVHPSGPMWGGGDSPVVGAAAVIEQMVVDTIPDWVNGLAALGLKQERRALRQSVRDLVWSFATDTLELSFTLARGGFATCVLRELVTAAELGLIVPPLLAPAYSFD